MRIFRENIYFAAMGAPWSGRLIAHRSNKGKLNIGDNIFDILCISDTEASYLLGELYSGGETPIVIMAGNGAVIIDRRLLYSTGVCCFIQPEFSADIVCSMIYRGDLGKYRTSPLVIKTAIDAKIQSDESFAQAYIVLSRYKSIFSTFSDRVESCDLTDVASRICDEMACSLVRGRDAEIFPLAGKEGVVYSNSLYALSVLISAFVSKIISGDRSLYLDRAGDEHISLSVVCDELPRGVSDVLNYLSAVARDRDAAISFGLSDGRLTLNVCPFYADVGLMGVKNPQKLHQD